MAAKSFAESEVGVLQNWRWDDLINDVSEIEATKNLSKEFLKVFSNLFEELFENLLFVLLLEVLLSK